MAAGLGSRFGKGIKQLAKVGPAGEIIMEYSIHDALEAGFNKVVFIIRKDIEKEFKEIIGDKIEKITEVAYVYQELKDLPEGFTCPEDRTKPWGTGQAVLAAKKAIQEPFLVINADDYYGRSAYKILGDYLSTLSNEDKTHAMVGFTLKNTMSPSGSVSRAVCVIKNGMLVSMEENTKIEYTADGGVVSHMPNGDVTLTGEEPVSMNFFGFTPKAFDSFMEYWENFKKENIREAKVECLLPNGVSEMVTSGQGSVKVFTTPDKWFGMTYPEDKANVMAELRNKIETGYYPEKLWEK